MEPAAKADDGNSKEALEKAFADQTADQLREVAVRLLKSTEGMKEMLADLEAEKQTLLEESEHMNSTISLMMQEMHKLNIGAGNTVEPQLDEGPLDFVGRLWEKVKPRDTAYQTDEHVGEIKKPVPGQEQPPPVQQVVQKASQEVVQKAQEIKTALGPLWARTQTFLSEKQNELAGHVAARAKQKGKGARSSGYAAGSSPPAAPGAGGAAASKDQPAAEAAAAAAAAGAEAASSSAGGASSGAPPAPEEAAAAAAASSSAAAAPAAGEAAEAPAAAGGDKGEGEAAAAAAAGEAAAPASGEEQISSTILIEARLTVDDGSVLTLHVRAADRCKEVAQRFVQENSLKAWFQEPLTAWLKKVEADAVKFPVKVEGDLSDIRKQYSKRK